MVIHIMVDTPDIIDLMDTATITITIGTHTIIEITAMVFQTMDTIAILIDIK